MYVHHFVFTCVIVCYVSTYNFIIMYTMWHLHV